MRWPWSRDPDVGEGAKAVASTEAALQEAIAMRPEVHAVAASLRELRLENHFADQILHAMRGR